MELDEITSYITKRFLTCTKACWRHFEFDIVQIKPPVMQLQLHLEQEQNVVFKTTKEDVKEALAENRDTMLTEAVGNLLNSKTLKLLCNDSLYYFFLW
jgi:hypothetical protein